MANGDTNCLHPVYDFLTRYVRKIHSDRYIKRTLAANPGVTFLEIIGPSDVAYVISLLKNSIDVWKYDLRRPEGTRPKPLYTNGENMKRECGKTAWNKDGVQYYEDALSKWKRVYKMKESFSLLKDGVEGLASRCR